MIDRSRIHFCLRRRTLFGAAAISAGLCALLPLVALICVLGGTVAFFACWILIIIMVLLGWGLLLVGIVAIIAGFFVNKSGEKGAQLSGVGCGTFLIGGVCAWLFHDLYSPVQETAVVAWTRCTHGGWIVISDVFLDYWVPVWSWSVLAVALLGAASIPLAVGLLRYERVLKYKLFKIGYTCPNGECAKRDVPNFFCTGCSRPVEDLWPSVYGLFSARCAHCMQDLWTLDFFGRLDYGKSCRHCSLQLDHSQLGRKGEYTLIVWGATNSGKSNLLVASLWKFETTFASVNDIRLEYSNQQEEQTYRQAVAGLERGRPVPKTSPDHRLAFNLSLHPTKGSGSLLFLFDVAGEKNQDLQLLQEQLFYRHVDGIMFVVDPLAESTLRQAYGSTANDRASAATKDSDYMLSQLLLHMERVLAVSSRGRFDIPIAVVLNKADFGGMAKKLRLQPDEPREMSATFAAAAEEARQNSPQIRHFFLDRGLGHLVRVLEDRFKRVSYFAASAFGQPLDSSKPIPFRPHGVTSPLIWLCHTTRALTDSSDTKRHWGNARRSLVRCLLLREGPGELIFALTFLLIVCIVLAGVLALLAGVLALVLMVLAQIPYGLSIIWGVSILWIVLSVLVLVIGSSLKNR